MLILKKKLIHTALLCITTSTHCYAGVVIGNASNVICNGPASTFGILNGGTGGFPLTCHTPNTPASWSTGVPYSWMSELTATDTLDGLPLSAAITVSTDNDSNAYQAATGVYGSKPSPSGNRWWTRVAYNTSLQASFIGEVVNTPPNARAESTTQGSGNLNELYTVYAKPITQINGWQSLPIGVHTFKRTVSAALQSGVFYNSSYMSKYHGNYRLTFSQSIQISRECNISPSSTYLSFGTIPIGQSKMLPLNINTTCDYPVTNEEQIAIKFTLSGDLIAEKDVVRIYKVDSSGINELIKMNKNTPILTDDTKFIVELNPNKASTLGEKVASLNITVINV